MRPIDADSLIEDIRYNREHQWYRGLADKKAYLDKSMYAEDRVEEAPTIDAVPVVRCLECKQYDADWFYCNRLDINTDHDFFCAYGEQEGEPDDDSC